MYSRFRFLSGATLALLLLNPVASFAQDVPKAPEAPVAPTPSPTPAAPTAPSASAAPVEPTPPAALPSPAIEVTPPVEATPPPAPSRSSRRQWEMADDDRGRVTFGHDAHLAEGERADVVVAIFGSATSAGEVREMVVAVFGDTRVSGPVGEGVVTVFGDARVNSAVREDVVVVGGNLELGPKADVGGQVVVVGGSVTRDPGARVHRGVNHIGFMPGFSSGGWEWLRNWFRLCLLWGRPLALDASVAWAWGVAGSFLALYVVLALLFRGGIEKCVQTLETHPGSTLLSSLLTLLLSMVLGVLLAVSLVGIPLLPFLGLPLLLATLFGKAALLAWLGRRITRVFGDGPLNHAAVAVIVGGVLVLGLYVVPFLGFLVYKLLGFIGVGVVVYTLILGSRREKAAARAAAAAAAAAAAPVAPPPASSSMTSPTPSAPSMAGVAPAVSSGFGGATLVGETAAPLPPPFVPRAVAPEPAPAVTVTLRPRAGFRIRMAALALDVILVGLLAQFVNEALPHKMRFDFDPGDMLPLMAIYGAIMWKLKSTTIGGLICGLKVVRLDGRELDGPTAVVRALGSLLSFVVLGLGFIWIAIDDEKQSWHDKIAGTAVVRVPRGASLV